LSGAKCGFLAKNLARRWGKTFLGTRRDLLKWGKADKFIEKQIENSYKLKMGKNRKTRSRRGAKSCF
jgi:hypothetical protein